MSKKTEYKRFESSLERRANRSFKLYSRELKEKNDNLETSRVISRSIHDIINTEDDYSDIHDPWEDDDYS